MKTSIKRYENKFINMNEQKFYVGDNPLNYYPFGNVNTCPMFIVPNFGTLNWDNISYNEVKKNILSLNNDADKLHENIMMYIHVPFCLSFCHYCNFARNKFPWKDKTTLDTYVDYLIKEIDFYMDRVPYIKGQRFSALYIGGGSPSTLGVDNIDRLLTHLQRKIPGYDLIEKTFTGEPKTLKFEDLIKILVDKGINRVTFGIETTNVKYRKLIGRTDTIEDVEIVFNNMDKFGFKGDISVDFMFNHPDQPFDDVVKDIQKVIECYNPTEIDVYNTIYVPYQPLHKRVMKGLIPQPANIFELLKMREYIYDYLLNKGYNNTISETYSKNKKRTQYQTAHCGRQDILGIGVAARGNLKGMVSINPSTIDQWIKNIDDNDGPSTDNLQKIGRDGVLHRLMTMWPRYKEMKKTYLEGFSDVKSFKRMKKILEKHLELKVIEETKDAYIINKLGVLWNPNLQWDYMSNRLNIWGLMIKKHFAEQRKNWGSKIRFKRTFATRFIDYFTDKYPRLMK